MSRQPIGVRRASYNMVSGITDRVGMPRIGKLRLGEKRKSSKGKEYPAETDHFRCDPDAALPEAERVALIDRFEKLYGKAPKVLHSVFFPTDEQEFVFPNALEAWKASKRWCHGDGVTASRLDFETGAYEQRNCCHVEACPVMSAGECKLVSRARFLLPEVTLAGYWQVDTGSQASTGNILDAINQLQRMFGRLTSIPLVLSREARQMVWEGKANTHYILNLRVPNVDVESLRRLVSGNHFALPAGRVELEVDDVDLPEELVPASEQGLLSIPVEIDPDLKAKIETGFAMLEIGKEEQTRLLDEYKLAPIALHKELASRWREKQAGKKGASRADV